MEFPFAVVPLNDEFSAPAPAIVETARMAAAAKVRIPRECSYFGRLIFIIVVPCDEIRFVSRSQPPERLAATLQPN